MITPEIDYEGDPSVTSWQGLATEVCKRIEREMGGMSGKVHNHGPDEGPGLDCPERRIGGRLQGRCMVWPEFPEPVIMSADEADVSRLEKELAAKSDVVNMPDHYTKLPVECIDVTEHFNFTLGNAIKYIWRADHKGKPVEDLKKAVWYLQREIARRERES